MRQYILESWNNYRDKVIPPTASNIQIQGCRRAFLAGAGIVLSVMINVIPDLSDAEGVKIIEAIRQEIIRMTKQETEMARGDTRPRN